MAGIESQVAAEAGEVAHYIARVSGLPSCSRLRVFGAARAVCFRNRGADTRMFPLSWMRLNRRGTHRQNAVLKLLPVSGVQPLLARGED
jgi:hypothetical protein